MENMGNIGIISDRVLLDLDYQSFVSLPSDLEVLFNRTHDLKLLLLSKPSRDKTFKEIIDLLVHKLNLTLSLFDEAQSLLVPKQKTRQKRGLINAFGTLSKFLFGTATEADINYLNDKIINLTEVINNNAKVLSTTVQYNNLQTKTINKITVALNDVEKQLENVANNLIDIIKIDLFLDNVLFEANSFVNLVRNHLNDLALTAKNIFSINLITPNDLLQVIYNAQTKFHLYPIFALDNLLQYYTILKAFFDHGHIIIEIPFGSQSDKINLYHFFPFPTFANHTPVIWNRPSQYVALSNATLSYAIVPTDILQLCTHTEHLYLCNSDFFEWRHSILNDECLYQYLLTQGPDFPACSYLPFLSSSPVVYKSSTSSYIFFNQSTSGTLNCHNGTTPTSPLRGNVVVLPSCSLSTPVVNIYATTTNLVKISRTRNQIP